MRAVPWTWVFQVDAEIPVTDVVFHDIREGDDDDGVPVAAAHHGLRGRPEDATLPPFAPRDAFEEELGRLWEVWEAERAAAAERAEVARLDAALGKQKDGAAVRFVRLVGELSPPPWDERLCAGFDIPDPLMERPPDVPETSTYRVPAPGDHPIPHARRAVARVIGAHPKVAYLDADGRRHELSAPSVAWVSVEEGGRRGVIGGGWSILEVDLEAHTARSRPRPAPREALFGVVCLAEGRVAVRTRTGLYVLDADDRVVEFDARYRSLFPRHQARRLGGCVYCQFLKLSVCADVVHLASRCLTAGGPVRDDEIEATLEG